MEQIIIGWTGLVIISLPLAIYSAKIRAKNMFWAGLLSVLFPILTPLLIIQKNSDDSPSILNWGCRILIVTCASIFLFLFSVFLFFSGAFVELEVSIISHLLGEQANGWCVGNRVELAPGLFDQALFSSIVALWSGACIYKKQPFVTLKLILIALSLGTLGKIAVDLLGVLALGLPREILLETPILHWINLRNYFVLIPTNMVVSLLSYYYVVKIITATVSEGEARPVKISD